MSERKIALITGGSRGIGFSCAKELAQNGCDIIINDIRTRTYRHFIKQCRYYKRWFILKNGCRTMGKSY